MFKTEALLLLLTLFSVSSTCQAAPQIQSQVLEEKAFQESMPWSGADGSYSILCNNKIVWLFGDTFIGTIEGGTRKNNQMIHNSIAVQSQADGSFKFFWRKGEDAGSFFADRPDYWLWPGDGVCHKKKLFLFAKRIEQHKGSDDPFGFSWTSDELIVIDNPEESPDNWQMRHLPLAFTSKENHLGTACLASDGMLYVLGLKEKSKEAIIARIALDKLEKLDLTSFEFLARSKSQESWSRKIAKAKALWTEAAAEASLSKTDNGLLCIYHEKGMGKQIVARAAQNPAGPWSGSRLIYTIPDTQLKRGFCYAAKAHPEQSAEKGYLTLTYAINPGPLAAHKKDPYAYFPRVLQIKLPELQDFMGVGKK